MANLKRHKPRALPETVDEALDRFWIVRSSPGHVPDYTGFQNWIDEKWQVGRSAVPLPIHAQATSAPLVQLVVQLSAAAKAAGIEITNEGAFPNPGRLGKEDGRRSKLKSFNRLKLLLSLFDGDSRSLRGLLSMMANRDGYASSISQNSTQLEYRAAFFRAVTSEDGHMAFKMLGRLREEEHDIGELAFLEATALFHSNRLDEAIQHARKVQKHAIDWPRAFMLILEAQALQGDFEALAAEIETTPGFVYPEFFIP